MYQTLLFLHLLSVVIFVAMHAVSAWVSLAVRFEREAGRIRALLDVSATSRPFTVASLLVIVLSGAALATLSHTWARGWVWVSVGLLVLVYGVMVGMASRYYNRLREAVGLQEDCRTAQLSALGVVAPAEVLEALLKKPMAYFLLAIGGSGLVLILGLMVYKPF